MNEPIFVKQYGVHFQGHVPYLHQSKDGSGASIPGGLESPFQVIGKGIPPHRIDPYDALPLPNVPKGFLNNQLVDLYLPKPIRRGNSYVIRALPHECFDPLEKLSQLGSPSTVPVRMWNGNRSKIESELETTNLIPLTVVGWGLDSGTILSFITNIVFTQSRNFIAGVDKMEPAPGTVDLTKEFYEMLPMLNQLTSADLQTIGNHFFRANIQKMSDNFYGYNST